MSLLARLMALFVKRAQRESTQQSRWRVVNYATDEHWYHVQEQCPGCTTWIDRGKSCGYLSIDEANRVMQALSGFTPVERVVSTASEINADAAIKDRWS